MSRKKPVLIGASVAVGALFGAIMLLRTRQPDFTVMVDRQAQFLQQRGYLLGDEDAFDYYYRAISTLRAHGATVQHVQAMSADDVLFRETRDNVMEYLRNAARQRECGMPEPRLFQNSIQHKNMNIDVEDVSSLVPLYMRRVLDLATQNDSADPGYVCFAIGVQLSRYRGHDVLWMRAIVTKIKALDWLVSYYEQVEDKESLTAVRDLRAQAEIEFEQCDNVLKKRRLWPWR